MEKLIGLHRVKTRFFHDPNTLNPPNLESLENLSYSPENLADF